MNIICAGMSRSGSTWQFRILRDILMYKFPDKFRHSGPWDAKIASRNFSHRLGLYVYKSERFLKEYLAIIDSVYCTVRHPFDVAVSLYRYRLAREYYQCAGEVFTMDEIINGELVTVIDWIENWLNLRTNVVNVIRYEDFYDDGGQSLIDHLSYHLSIPLNKYEKNYILEGNSIPQAKKMILNQDKWFSNETTMYTMAHIGPNDGKPGQGHELLLPHQKEQIKSYAGEFMNEYQYE